MHDFDSRKSPFHFSRPNGKLKGKKLRSLSLQHEDIGVAEPSRGATLTFLKSKVGFLNDRVKPN